MNIKILAKMLLFLVAVISALRADAAENISHEIGFRANIVLGKGEPTNDIPGFGLIGRHRLAQGWLLGYDLGISSKFDFERPWKMLGLQQGEGKTIDAVGSSIMLSVLIEKRYEKADSNIIWLWNAGLGINSIDMNDVQGPTDDGDTFDITTDAETEAVVSGGVGFIHRYSNRWSARYELAFEYRFADWKVTDRVSGNQGIVGDYHTVGPRIGIIYIF